MEVHIEVVKQLVRVNISWQSSTYNLGFKDSWNIVSWDSYLRKFKSNKHVQ